MSQASLVIQETPLDAIRVHPRNLRRQVGDVAEMAQSMKERGVLEPLIVAPGLDEEAGVVLIAGHRRLAAARLAKLATVPTIFRSDLDSEAKQVIAMLIENGQRADLSAIEEARGYQLAFDLSGDLTPAKLSMAVGKPATRVRGRLGLLRLPEEFQERVHGGQVTIADAEALAEFAAEPAALKRLLSEAGTPMFQYAVERERRRREAQRRGAENRKQLEQAGIQIVEEPSAFPWASVEKPVSQLVDPEGEAPEGHVGPVPFTPERHAACAYHAALIERRSGEIVYLCRNSAVAGHIRQRQAWERDSEPISPEEEERRAQEAEAAEQLRAERRESLGVAAKVRHDFTRDLLQRPRLGGKAATLDAARFVVAAMWEFIAEAYDWGPDELSEFADLIWRPDRRGADLGSSDRLSDPGAAASGRPGRSPACHARRANRADAG
jgi:ParB/RepB/Spo0J family partition protein